MFSWEVRSLAPKDPECQAPGSEVLSHAAQLCRVRRPVLLPQARGLSVSFCLQDLWTALYFSTTGFPVCFCFNHLKTFWEWVHRLHQTARESHGTKIARSKTQMNTHIWKPLVKADTSVKIGSVGHRNCQDCVIPLPDFWWFSLTSCDLFHLLCTLGLGPFASKMSMSGSFLSLTSPS